MRIVILGGGAIGRLFGSFLIKGGNNVTLIENNRITLDALQKHGIGLQPDNSSAEEVDRYPITALESADSIDAADLVLVLVKSQATLAAIKDAAHLIGNDCPLLSIQTGLGNLEIASQIIPRENILMGITFMSGTALTEGKVSKGAGNKTYIGEINGTFSSRLEKINTMFNRCGIETQMVKRIIGRLWCKVLTYSAINPVSAILQVPNGVLVSRMESITLMKRLLDEGQDVARAHSIELVYPDLYELLFDACENRANNLSAMLQDILNELPTEIDAQNGAIVRYAKERNISVPTHQTMVELIKLQECWKPESR
ncbi:ketopantoate reductase family protein [Desulforhopalus singaporensis]|uniref:2-dehydropantoate 2-reductase n=1 Tax=Desulforhopalus singaporensis TaxID=91360 RepID=A0A1H0JZS7_9BACT|nr:2-dehydropantoate 2-reductase [Desulforhopalus singaporensis]SDO48921.1 2-dehydropantoate 2-reductase [Desulforhopalus singaporensis]